MRFRGEVADGDVVGDVGNGDPLRVWVEAHLSLIAENERVRLKLGDAFDVTADKKQTDFRRREPTNQASYVFESAYEITLRNAKSEAVMVVVREPVPGDWKMLEESARHAKVAAGTAEWRVAVPAEGSTTLRYRVLARF